MNPPLWTPTNSEYHAVEQLSSSALKTFHDSPRLYKAEYIDKTITRPETRAIRLGHVLSQLLRGAARELTVVDVQSRTTKTFQQALAAATEPADVVTVPEYAQAHGMCEAILHPETPVAEQVRGWLLDGSGWSEYAVKDVRYRGIWCKAMIDRAVPLPADYWWYYELKSTQIKPSPDWPRKLSRHILDMRYDLRCSFSASIITQATRCLCRGVTIIYIHNEPPYEMTHITLPPDVHEDATLTVQNLVDAMKEKLWMHDWEREAYDMEVPPWYGK